MGWDRDRSARVLLSAFAATFVFAAASLAEDSAVGSNAAQAYVSNCAACHGTDLEGPTGPNIGVALTGAAFRAKWAKVPADEFIAYVQRTMPLSQPGSLDDQTAALVSNFVLARNSLVLGKGPASAEASKVKVVDEGAAQRISDKPEDGDPDYRFVMAQRAARLQGIRPVSATDLNAPAADDWLSWRGTSSTHAFSELKQIDRTNVRGLASAWSLSLEQGVNSIAPIVRDGVMFINNNGTVFALDARNGDELWHYARPAKGTMPMTQTRGMALYGSTLYVPTLDNHMLALAVRTGKLLWDSQIAPPKANLQLTAAPLVANGKVIQGVSACTGNDVPGGCYIVALDAKTGKEAWRFYTIARPGQPGGDSWNGAPLEKRFGGGVWQTGSYDPELNLIFFGVGQTYIISTLLDDQGRKGSSNDALYTNSTVALNPDTGKLVWYYQHGPADMWDFDWSFERTIILRDTTKGPKKTILTAGKVGIFDALDAETGKYLWSYDLGFQNIITHIDPKTGRKTYNPDFVPPEVGKPDFICPAVIGNRNWLSTAYDTSTNLIFVPVNPTCMDFARGRPGGREWSIVQRQSPQANGKFGVVMAVDVKKQRLAWVDRKRAPISSALLATAGGLIFVGERDRAFRALDSANGKTLWQTYLPAVPNSFPFSYAVDGRQYVAVVAGGGSAVDRYLTAQTPELAPSTNHKTISVFSLP